jgi:hypothetical protein
MHFAGFPLILYPAILTIRLLIVCIGLLSFVGCGGAPTPVPSPAAKDFSIALSPATITAIAGGSQSTFAVSTTAQNGFANAVMVTLSGLPAGATASPASPFSVPAGGSQTVTLSIPPTVSAGNFTLTASGTSAALTHSATLALTVDPGQDFSIATVPSTLTVTAGGSTSFAVSITGENGFSDSVAVTLSGLPAGVTTSPASPIIVAAGGSQAVTLSLPPTVSAGNFTLTASGTSAALTHTATLALTVDPVADFNIVLSGAALTVNAGFSSSFTVSITAQGGFAGSVAVTLAGLPAGATTSPASPFTVAAGSSQPVVVVVSVPATVFAGNFPLTVSGTSAALAHSAQLILTVLGQMQVTTWHYDVERTSANLWETVLTPANVNSASFGKLLTQPVDGYVVGHPLYLPAVNIPGQGAHNVVYVATMHDSVYAFDADSATAPALWMTSILTYSPAGATTVPAAVAKNAGTTAWTELGIISTPVIDPATGTLYLVAETYENGMVVHRLHALDVTTGLEKFGGPTTITATYTLNGKTTTFTDLYQMNRPGLLLANSHIYIGFGSNSNNDYSQGWVLSYNESTLQQEGAYTTEPGDTLASIWQKGAGLSADSLGNIYAQTGEGPFTAGTNLSSSVLKLSQSGTTLALADWFTPYNQQYLSAHDLDLNDGVLILPDQPGPYPHELITGGKEGTIYVLNRDAMGQYCSTCTTGDTQIVQELPLVAHSTGIPVYWNNTVYFTAESQPISAYNLSNGALVVPPVQSVGSTDGGGHAMITANGNSNGILWFVTGNSLWAMDAVTLNLLYTSNQAANGRDTVPPLAHFANPIAADGRVFLGTQNSLVVYGLLSGSAALGESGNSYKVVSGSPRQAEAGERGR